MDKKKIALVTYNTVGEGRYPQINQGKSSEVYIFQGKDKWASKNPVGGISQDAINARTQTARNVMIGVSLDEMDQVYVYVGEKGGHEMVTQTASVPSDKITYLMCGHNRDMNDRIISAYRGWNFKKIDCECGGRDTLERILKGLLA